MKTLIVLFFVFSVLSVVVSVYVLIYLRKAVKKEHEHIQKLFRTVWKLKDHLQAQIGLTEKKLNEHQKNQEGWEAGLREWVKKELGAQDLRNRNYVEKISASLDAIAKSRMTMSETFTEFVRLLRAAMREESALLKGINAPDQPTAGIQPDPGDKGSTQNEPQ